MLHRGIDAEEAAARQWESSGLFEELETALPGARREEEFHRPIFGCIQILASQAPPPATNSIPRAYGGIACVKAE